MASLQYSSELMTNYVPALPVPPSEKFVTCLDPVTRRPMVFAVNKAAVPKLNLLKEDEKGQPQLVDFSRMLGIPDNQTVVAFDCQQAADLSIYLCVAVALDATRSSVLVVKPFQMTANPILEILPAHSVGSVQKIFMGCPDANLQSYPMILVTGQPVDRIVGGSDITRILVDPYLTSWTSLRDFALPANFEQVLDIAPAANAYGRGIYVLCKAQDGPQIIGEFTRYDTDQNDGSLYWFNVALRTPQGASRIATFTDTRGRSSLLVGCDAGLQLYSASQATSKYADGTLISSNVLFQNSSTLRVAQDKDLVTVWSIGKDGSLGYIRSSSSTLAQGIPVPLLPSGQVSAFSASVSNPLQGAVAQTLITNDKIGNLSLLQQYVDTGLWRKQPFYYASAAANIEIPSYNISLYALDRTKQPVSQGTIDISASSYVDVIINGKPITLTTDATTIGLDASGEIAIIIATDSVASQTFTVASIRDKKGADVGFQSVAIDPSAKVVQAFQNARDLRNAKTTTGARLLDGVQDIGDDVINIAQDLFGQLLTVNDSLQDKQKRSNLPPAQKAFAESFHWAKQKLSEAVAWGLKRISEGWKFFCTIAGQTIDFVLDTAEKIGEAFTWIWQKIKLGIDKLIEFAGFLFSWDDILATKDTIVTFTNAVVDCGISSMENVRTKVNGMLDNLESSLGINTSSQVQSDSTSNKKSDNSIMNSPPVKWLTERLKNGGAEENATISDDSATKGDNTDVMEVVEKDLQLAVHQVTDVIADIGQKVTDLFSGSGNASAGALLNDIKGTMLSAMMQALRGAVNGFLKVAVKLLQYFKDLGNYKIEMPVFTPLYRKYVRADPTLLDIIALFIAVPMTIITKLITGKAPPTLPAKLNPKVISFMFAYNGQFMSEPFNARAQTAQQQVTDGTTAPEGQHDKTDSNVTASRKAMAKLVGDQQLTTDDKIALGLLLGKTIVDQALEDMISDIRVFVKIAPTILAGMSASIATIMPVSKLLTSLWSMRKGAAAGAAAAAAKLMPERSSRFRSIALSFLPAVITCVYPHTEKPGVVPRLFSAATTLSVTGFLTLFTIADYEDMYQFLYAMGKTVNFGLYCGVYSEELDAHDWSGYDVDCSGLGVSGITLQYVSDMAGFITFHLMKKLNFEAAAAAMTVQFGAGVVSGALQIARFALQVQRKYLPNYMSS